jgi:hypothetical protein
MAVVARGIGVSIIETGRNLVSVDFSVLEKCARVIVRIFLIALMPSYTQNVLGKWCIVKYALLGLVNIAYHCPVY